MGDNKISEAAVEAGLAAWDTAIVQPTTTAGDCMRRALEAALPHLQGEAVPVAWSYFIPYGYNDDKWEEVITRNPPSGVHMDAKPLYEHPQPAELSEVSGNSGELEAIKERLDAYHIGQVCDKEEIARQAITIRNLRAALAATGKQQVGEVPVANGKLVAWWNGITPGYDGQGDWSIRWGADAENSRHDIPLYDGYNPIHYQQPAQGMDLGQFRPFVQDERTRLAGRAERYDMLGPADALQAIQTKIAECDRLLALIDGRDAGTGVE